MEINLNKIGKEVQKLVEKSGKVLREGFWTEKRVEAKGERDVVSEYDRRVEKILVEGLREKYPEIGVEAEESGEIAGSEGKLRWVIDPLDGSSHYLRGVPIFCVSVALQKGAKKLLGVVFNPMTEMYFEAEAGRGAKLNGRELKVSKESDLEKSQLYVEFPEEKVAGEKVGAEEFDQRMKDITQLTRVCRGVEHHRIGSWGLALTASGGYEAYLDLSGSTKPWDVAAGMLLVQEAGGEIMMMRRDGQEIGLAAGNSNILAKIREELGLEMIRMEEE